MWQVPKYQESWRKMTSLIWQSHTGRKYFIEIILCWQTNPLIFLNSGWPVFSHWHKHLRLCLPSKWALSPKGGHRCWTHSRSSCQGKEVCDCIYTKSTSSLDSQTNQSMMRPQSSSLSVPQAPVHWGTWRQHEVNSAWSGLIAPGLWELGYK